MAEHSVPDHIMQSHEHKLDTLQRDIGKVRGEMSKKMPVGAFILTLVSLAIALVSLGGAVLNGMWSDNTAYKLKTDYSIMEIAREQVRLSTEQDKFGMLQKEVRTKLGMTGQHE